MSDVTILWENNRWDVPLNGLCTYNGRAYWFELLDNKTYGIFELTDAELRQEFERHQLFVRYVGYHCDYEDGERRVTACKPRTSCEKFYDYHKANPLVANYLDRMPIYKTDRLS